jgi:hypothetical protein
LIYIKSGGRQLRHTLGMSEGGFLGWLVVCAIVAVAAYVIARRRRAARILGTRVLIGEAMARKGITPADAAAAGPDSEVFAASRRCASCAVDPQCRAVLSQGAGDVPAECPNRGFFARIAAHKRSQEMDPPPSSSTNTIA